MIVWVWEGIIGANYDLELLMAEQNVYYKSTFYSDMSRQGLLN